MSVRQVEAAAKENNRSLNSEIVSRLERTFRNDGEQKTWHEITQSSPMIGLEKRLLALELDLERQIDELKAEIAALKQR